MLLDDMAGRNTSIRVNAPLTKCFSPLDGAYEFEIGEACELLRIDLRTTFRTNKKPHLHKKLKATLPIGIGIRAAFVDPPGLG